MRVEPNLLPSKGLGFLAYPYHFNDINNDVGTNNNNDGETNKVVAMKAAISEAGRLIISYFIFFFCFSLYLGLKA